MMDLKVLGGVELSGHDGREKGAVLAQPKRLALLAYLAINSARGFTRRDTIVAMFWPELDAEHARNSLSQALRFLRRELGDAVIVSRGENLIAVDTGAIDCDVVRFDTACNQGDHARAVEIFRGELLQGFFVADASPDFDEWLAAERARLRSAASRSAWSLAERLLEAGDPDRSAHWARAAVALAPDDERGVRRLLQLLVSIGDRAGAMRAYDAFAERLASEFNVRPSPETDALVSSMRVLDSSAQGTTVVSAPGVPRETVPAVLAPRSPPRNSTWKGTRVAAVVGLGGLATVAALLVLSRTIGSGPAHTLFSNRSLALGDTIVLADFVDHINDSTLSATVSESFRIDLEQSRAIRLMSPNRVRAALRRMERASDERLSLDEAREVAIREGAKAVLTGEINAARPGILLSARLVSAETGDVLLATKELAADSTQLMDAIDHLSNALREHIGESLRTIRATPALSQVTTTSLQALRLYTSAIRALRTGDPQGCFRLLRGAISIDTTFAEAYRTLAAQLTNYPGASRRETVDAMTKAFLLRGRLPGEQQHFVAGNYYWFVVGDPRASIREYQAALDILPTFRPALNNLHQGYAALRDFDSYRKTAVRRLQIDSTSSNSRFHDVESLLMLGRLDSAQTALTRLDAFAGPNLDNRLPGVRLAFQRRDYASVRKRAKALQAPGDQFAATGAAFEAYADAIEGQLEQAERHWNTAVERARASGNRGDALRWAAEFSDFMVMVRRDTARAAAYLRSVQEKISLDSMDALDRPYARLAIAHARAGDLNTARRLLKQSDSLAPASLLGFDGRHLREHALGVVALEDRKFTEAILRFGAADSGDCVVCVLPDLARAYDRSMKPDSAIAVYERFVNAPDDDRAPVDAVALAPAMRRLGELYEQRGDGLRAANYYQQFLRLRTVAGRESQAEVTQVRYRLQRSAKE